MRSSSSSLDSADSCLIGGQASLENQGQSGRGACCICCSSGSNSGCTRVARCVRSRDSRRGVLADVLSNDVLNRRDAGSKEQDMSTVWEGLGTAGRLGTTD